MPASSAETVTVCTLVGNGASGTTGWWRGRSSRGCCL
jgi:hypothetical protein